MTLFKKIFIQIGIIFVQFIFLLLIDFALGGITYFILAILGAMPYPSETRPQREYLWVLINNFAESIIALIILNLSLAYIHKLTQKRAWQFIIIILGIYLLENFIYSLILNDNPSFIRFLKMVCFPNPVYLVFQLHIIVATCIVYYFYTRDQIRTRKITEQEYQLLKLNDLKTKAELEALQAKVNPHFLYNSLNSIAGLVHLDPDKAEKMVLLLAKFFRYSTNRHHDYFCTIKEELEIVETYLEVEKVRFDERLNYQIKLANEDLYNYLIPRFLIQPLVENAIKHGIGKIAEKGFILIDIQSIDNQLFIIIEDNGKAFSEDFQSGYGLQSTQDKLRLLGGKNAMLEIINQQPKQIRIHLELRKNTTENLVMNQIQY
jgi:sensor histidine kinase YesM